MPKRRYRPMRGISKRRRTTGRYNGRMNPIVMSRRTGLVRRLGQEVNFVDTAITNHTMDTTGSISLLATIPQGPSQNQRIGKKIMLKSIQVRGNVSAVSTTLATKGTWIIVYDKRPTGVLPGITDILNSISSNSLTNSTNSGRFTIIKRQDYSVVGNNNTAGQGTDKTYYSIEKFIKIPKRVVFKAAGTGAIGDIEQGALYFITVGANAGGNVAVATVTFRTRFYDM